MRGYGGDNSKREYLSFIYLVFRGILGCVFRFCYFIRKNINLNFYANF